MIQRKSQGFIKPPDELNLELKKGASDILLDEDSFEIVNGDRFNIDQDMQFKQFADLEEGDQQNMEISKTPFSSANLNLHKEFSKANNNFDSKDLSDKLNEYINR